MAHEVYLGNTSNLANNVKKVYLGNENGTALKVKKGWIGGDDGTAKLFFTGDLTWGKYNTVVTNHYNWEKYDVKQGTMANYTRYNISNYKLDYGSGGRTYTFYYPKTFYNRVYVTNDKTTVRDTNAGSTRITSRSNVSQAIGKYISGVFGGGGNYSNYVRIDYIQNSSITDRFTASYRTFLIVDGPGPGSYVDTQGNLDVSIYPSDGVYNGYWYERISDTTHTGPMKGDNFIENVTSTVETYPDNGEYEGYWYVQGITTITYSQGTFISNVEAPEGTYPTNGRHTDGYWYVLIG